MSDLANLLGDGDGTAIRKVLPVTAGIKVCREGEKVVVTIGNADPIRLRWQTAYEEGQTMVMRSAVRWKVPLHIGPMRQPLWFAAADARKIGHWMLTKATEAKFLAGERKRFLVERR